MVTDPGTAVSGGGQDWCSPIDKWVAHSGITDILGKTQGMVLVVIVGQAHIRVEHDFCVGVRGGGIDSLPLVL